MSGEQESERDMTGNGKGCKEGGCGSKEGTRSKNKIEEARQRLQRLRALGCCTKTTLYKPESRALKNIADHDHHDHHLHDSTLTTLNRGFIIIIIIIIITRRTKTCSKNCHKTRGVPLRPSWSTAQETLQIGPKCWALSGCGAVGVERFKGILGCGV